MSAGANLKDLRRLLDKEKVPTFVENMDSANLPVLVAVRRDGKFVYILVSRASFAVRMVGPSTEHATIREAFNAVMDLWQVGV